MIPPSLLIWEFFLIQENPVRSCLAFPFTSNFSKAASITSSTVNHQIFLSLYTFNCIIVITKLHTASSTQRTITLTQFNILWHSVQSSTIFNLLIFIFVSSTYALQNQISNPWYQPNLWDVPGLVHQCYNPHTLHISDFQVLLQKHIITPCSQFKCISQLDASQFCMWVLNHY